MITLQEVRSGSSGTRSTFTRRPTHETGTMIRPELPPFPTTFSMTSSASASIFIVIHCINRYIYSKVIVDMSDTLYHRSI